MRIIDKGKVIAPFLFIDVAKKNRLYAKLTECVINNTLEAIAKYEVPCSLNISKDDTANEQTVKYLLDKLDTFCKRIRSFRATISLDDFGSGYSNFSHILNLPVDFIKIDASLISNIDRDINSQIMVETIVSLANNRYRHVVPELLN